MNLWWINCAKKHVIHSISGDKAEILNAKI